LFRPDFDKLEKRHHFGNGLFPYGMMGAA